VTWRDRALGHLAKNRPDVRRLLLWAEKQTVPIDENGERAGAAETGVMDEVGYVLFEGIKHLISDNLLSRARLCGDGRGLELWRRLHSEWQGAAPQVVAAKAKRFQDPAKCSNVLALWEALPAWEQLGAEVAAGGLPMPDWLRANSLEKLLPDEMLKTVVGRPELADYAPKMLWVRAQMEHAKSIVRANGVATKSKKEHEDVDMGNLEEPPEEGMLANLQAECGKMAAAGDWQGMEHIANAICALTKGKGKGKSGGFKGKGSDGKGFKSGWPTTEYGKGNPKGGKPSNLAGGKGGKGTTFDGTCHHCGKYGHRKVECRALDAEMSKNRALNNVGENGETPGDEGPTPPPGEEDVWWMGAAYSLTPEPPKQQILVSNRFNALRTEEGGPTLQGESVLQVGGLRCSGERCGGQRCIGDPTMQRSAVQANQPYSAPVTDWPILEGGNAQHRRSNRAGAPCTGNPTVQGSGQAERGKRRYVPFDESVYLLMDEKVEEGKSTDKDLNALGVKSPGAVLVEAVVDSGAADPVAKAGTFVGKVSPSSMSKAGRRYRGPDGTRIPNEGQLAVQFETDEGHKCGMTWQIANVERPLVAVSHLSAAGNEVTFTKTGGKIVNTTTGKTIDIQKKGGVYVLRMWVPGPTGPSPSKPFTRPATTK
jgi:hypothetical protein